MRRANLSLRSRRGEGASVRKLEMFRGDSVSLQGEGATFQRARNVRKYILFHEAASMTPTPVTPFINRVMHRCAAQTDTPSGLQAGRTCSHISLAHLLYIDGRDIQSFSATSLLMAIMIKLEL